MLSDRDAIIALMNAVLAIGEKLTGERMTVNLHTESGEEIQISGADVSWKPIAAGRKILPEAA